MKKFLIKINGNQYEVEVEEVKEGTVTAAASTEAVNKPAQPAAPSKEAAVKAPVKDTPVPSGATTVTAPMPGTILKVNVNPGDKVKKGQVLLILEAMKMENEIVAPGDGTVATVNVSKGSAVNAGDMLVSLA
jgi:biotin carboxyl carrier protein